MALAMRFFRISVSLHSPAIVTKRRTATGFLGALDHIPASTLRGAVISALYWNGVVNLDWLSQESKTPRLIVSPAYPLVDGRHSRPAHPFIYVCKKCEIEGGEGYLRLAAGEAIEKIRDGEDPTLPYECSKGHRALKQLHPRPVLIGENLEEVQEHHFRVVCVGISRTRASSVKGMLYSYEALAEGAKFWATIAAPANLDLERANELFIGRGKSRGMGRASMKIEAEIDLAKEADAIKDHIGSEWVALYSLSPLLGSDELGWSTYPKSIDLKQLAARSGLECAGSLNIVAAYGRIIRFSSGWDLMSGKGRPVFEARAPGTVVRARLIGVSPDKAALTLATLRYLGTICETSDAVVTGVNMLMPFTDVGLG
jgi:hypothetical protein